MSEQPLRNEMHQYLDQIVTSQKYMLRQAEAELEKLNAYENPTAFELLCVRAFTHAYAGMNEAAISDLTALASQKEGQTPRILNKLAQVLLRQGGLDNISQVSDLSARVLSLPDSSQGDRWLAYHNMALACLSSKDYEGARAYETKALLESDDSRSRIVLNFVNSSQAPDAKDMELLSAAGPEHAPAKSPSSLPELSPVPLFIGMEH
jgi:hypothetical protein